MRLWHAIVAAFGFRYAVASHLGRCRGRPAGKFFFADSKKNLQIRKIANTIRIENFQDSDVESLIAL